MKWTWYLIIAASLVLIPACANKHKPSGMSYKDNWKAEWMKECLGVEPTTEEFVNYCECVADQMIQELTVDQLMDDWYATEYFIDKISPLCPENALSTGWPT